MKVKKDVGKVEVSIEGSVATLTLSRLEALNAITWEMYNELEQHLERLEEDEMVRVLVIRGAGEKALAAGTDISQFEGFTGQDGIQYEKQIDKVISKLERFPKPTIAAVQGIAVGGGLIIATACDLRYSNSNGKFGAPMSKTLGNCLSLENYTRLERELGRMRTKELLYTARIISAEEANEIGFLTGLFEDENFFEQVSKIAHKISERAPLTVTTTKKAFNAIDDLNTMAVNENHFEKEIYEVYDSKDFAEGVRSYLEKTKPSWSGQ